MSEATNKHDKFISALAIGGASLPLTEGALVGVAHGGIVGGILALGASGIVWLVADEMAKHGRGIKLSANAAPTKRDKPAGEHGVLYRVFNGRDVREGELLPQPQSPSNLRELYLRLGELLRPHINEVLSNRIAILGMPGAGKSNLVAKLCEGLAGFGVPLIIFDTKPEYGSMCDRPYFRNPLRASAKNVTPGNARGFAKQVLSDRLQVVLDLRSYRDDNTAAQIMIDIIESVWEYEEALKDTGKKRLPCMFVLDEAHYWLSQGQQMSNVSKKEDKETGISLNTKLQATFFNLVNIGRSFGMGSVIATQRPANIDKRAIAPAEWKFLMKANQPQDITAYKDFGFGEEARKLGKGQAYIIGPGEFADGAVYQIEKRESPDEAETPGIENLREDDTTILPDEVEMLINSMPDIDLGDSRDDGQALWSTANYRLSGVVRAPAYEHTVYSAASPNKTVYNSVYSPVNVSTSGYDGQQTGLLNEEINDAPEREGVSGDQLNVNAKVDTSKVSVEKRELIQRLVAMKVMNHRDIAKAVKLDGPKYAIYKQVCAEEGIEIK